MTTGGQPVSPKVLALACAADSDLFSRTFFPKTMRQKSPEFAREIWKALEDPTKRFVNLRIARGFGKTTRSRLYLAKRIAYGLSYTILYVASSEMKATQSLKWLRTRIARRDPTTGEDVQTDFARFFGLRKGSKWSETELEIIHDLDSRPIWVLALGMTSDGLRGVNFDDYRPDLIYCDDILTDENASTPLAREKTNDLIFGAVRESLAPVVDDPNAKMVLNQTPRSTGDISDVAAKDPAFFTVDVPCWTKETVDLPVERQVSAWPEREPTDTLRLEKKQAIESNRYSIFAREKEVRLVTKENAAFRLEWIRYHELPPPMYCVLAIDPVPPPSDRQLAMNLRDKDFECQAVVGRKNGEYYVLDYVTNRGHEPDWSVTTALSLARTWRVSQIVVEAIAYQRTLKWLLEQEMKRRRLYYVVNAYADSRKKYARITSTLAGPLSQGRVLMGKDMHELLLQIETYKGDPNEHDDVLDAVSIGLSALINPYLELEGRDAAEDEEDFEPMEIEMRAP